MAARIAICDDDPVICGYLDLALGVAGFDVAGPWHDPQTALAALHGTLPDILLLDLHMPGGSGLDLLEALARRGWLNTMRVLMLTGEDDTWYMERAMKAGASGYLTKPVDPVQLVAKLRRLLADRRLRWIDDISAVVAPFPVREIVATRTDRAERVIHAPNRKRVLSVDDVKCNQQLIALLLPDDRYIVDLVQSGADALAAVDKIDYDLLLLDMRLPDIDGLDVVRTIRRSGAKGRLLPIVAISADTMPCHVEQAKAAGVDDYLAKPFTGASLTAAADRALKLRPAEVGDALNPTVASLTESYGKAAVDRLLRKLLGHLAEFDRTEPDIAALEYAAHAIKGAAVSLGFTEVSQACVELENACRTGQVFEIRLRDVLAAVSKARVEIAEYLAA